ncbi:hypothetical protein O6P43_014538 [Quillaja saponaria]|uniref:Uncharacterized protein n=1 Tax=Quillaja saponaria TaxID=32244 RepID=A0AAD7PS11_QUISA|nr:hypothetical protein O6P43_014538 [Quillaja saponaria]
MNTHRAWNRPSMAGEYTHNQQYEMKLQWMDSRTNGKFTLVQGEFLDNLPASGSLASTITPTSEAIRCLKNQ